MWNIGVDIVEVERFRKMDYETHKNFYQNIFTLKEIEYCLSHKDSAQRFASTFAGKEAVYKAISERLKVGLNEIEIVRDSGIPKVNIYPVRRDELNSSTIKVNVKVSLSHTRSFAVAFAIATFEENEQT
ncbi:MAG: holo-ACP synthase [Nitrososphaerota archaeon]|nr:holo-ACP synthase [Candidatus Bathyarchaeota archaeon]MDW8049035.1 holo-ACP synthase [Nitrososphaerota archaeon]